MFSLNKNIPVAIMLPLVFSNQCFRYGGERWMLKKAEKLAHFIAQFALKKIKICHQMNPTHTISPKWFKASEPEVLQKLQFMVM